MFGLLGYIKFRRQFVNYLAGLAFLVIVSLMVPYSNEDNFNQNIVARFKAGDVYNYTIIFCMTCVAVFFFFKLKYEANQFMDDPMGYFVTFWNWFDVSQLSVTLISFVTFLVGSTAFPPSLAICVYLRWFGILFFFQPLDSTGALVCTIYHIVKSLRHFLLIFMVSLLAYSCALFVLVKKRCDADSNIDCSEADSDFSNPFYSFLFTFKMLFTGDYDIGMNFVI